MRFNYNIEPSELVGGLILAADSGSLTVSRFGRTFVVEADYDGLSFEEQIVGSWEKHPEWDRLVEIANTAGDFWVQSSDPVVEEPGYWLWFNPTAGATYYLKKVGS